MTKTILQAGILWVVLSLACSLTQKVSPNEQTGSNTPIFSSTPLNPSDTPTITWTPLPTATTTPDKTATRAASDATAQAKNVTAQAKLTQTAQPMVNLVQTLFDEGYISSKQGSVKNISDFSESWAQIDWYRWWYQLNERTYSNFILSLDAKMESASDKANWDFAGCGIIFHAIDENNYYALFIAQDGTLTLVKRLNDVGNLVKKSKKFTTNIPVENLHVVFVVEDIQVTVFVDEQEVLSARDSLLASKLNKGKIGFSVMSGTNKGYGTRCTMKYIQFWEIK